jgi:ABC-type branched-subunit amino acid transport system ATPase component/ABC-type branched-subunit amino acid transport system permease subunit
MLRPGYLLVAAISVLWVLPAANYWVFTVSYAIAIAIAALGLMVVVGWAREVSLAHAGLMGTGVFIFGYLYRDAPEGKGYPFLLAAVVVVCITAGLMGLVALVSLRLPGVYVMVLTLGLQFMLEQTIFTDQKFAGGLVAIETPRPRPLGISLESDRVFYFFLLGCLAAVLLILTRLRFSHIGRALILAGNSRQAAASVGVPPWRYKLYAFMISGALAGLAGVLSASLFRSVPGPQNYVAFVSLFLLAIPVLAGFDSMLTVVLVAVSFNLASQALESFHINVLLLGGTGIIAGTLLGSRGLAGAATKVARAFRPNAVALRREALGAQVRDREAAVRVVKEHLERRRGSGDVALAVRGTSVAFGGVQALQDVSITIPAGSFVGLIGPNGAGKTTLFDVVSGVRVPDRGEVALFGKDVTGLGSWGRAAEGLTRTFQAARVVKDLPISDNLLAGAYLSLRHGSVGTVLGRPRNWRRAREAERLAWAVAQLLEIEVFWADLAGALHFSARRRAEIGRAIIAEPRLLLLDEPGAGLDPVTTANLFDLVKRLHRDLGLTVLLVEHYVPAVLDACDHVYVLDAGRIIASGSPDEVVANDDVRERYLGQETVRTL